MARVPSKFCPDKIFEFLQTNLQAVTWWVRLHPNQITIIPSCQKCFQISHLPSFASLLSCLIRFTVLLELFRTTKLTLWDVLKLWFWLDLIFTRPMCPSILVPSGALLSLYFVMCHKQKQCLKISEKLMHLFPRGVPMPPDTASQHCRWLLMVFDVYKEDISFRAK